MSVTRYGKVIQIEQSETHLLILTDAGEVFQAVIGSAIWEPIILPHQIDTKPKPTPTPTSGTTI